MKEIKDPIVGNLLVIRHLRGNIGVIEDIFVEHNIKNIKIRWILNPNRRQQIEIDHAYPMIAMDNFYVYLNCKDTPQHRLVLQLKYA